MKKAVFVGLFIFSVAANLAVAATVGWHLLRQSQAQVEPAASTSGAPTLTREDLQAIRQAWPRQAWMNMKEARDKIMEKNLEVLQILSKHPGDISAANQQINELEQLKAQMDREAFLRLAKIFASLPEDKRQAFALFVKNRACMGPCMGMRGGGGPGRGRGKIGGCPMRSR